MGITTDLIVIVIAALVGGALAHLLRQPLICGFILAGVIVGPHTGGYTVQNVDAIEKLAEIGVALLLFTLGLEFSFGELRRLLRVSLVVTPLQVFLCSVLAYSGGIALGLSQADAMWVGAAVSLSSTMVVLKTLAARDSLETAEGKIMLSILIAQDLAVVPLMLVLPQLSGSALNLGELAQAGIKSAAFLVAMYFAGTRLLPVLFSLIAQQRSRELFFLSTLGFALGAGYLSHELGLSFALGAFVAGMLLSETDFNHQALSDVAHLRDLFAMLFFVSVGMLCSPEFLASHIWTISLLVCLIIVLKAAVVGTLVLLSGFEVSVALAVACGVSQIGEFSFVLLNVGRQSGAVSTEAYSLMISVTVLSMMVTPSLFSLSEVLQRKVAGSKRVGHFKGGGSAEILRDHVIIVGAGVVGRYVAQVLQAAGFPYIVIENDYKVATQMRDRRINVVFGDGSHGPVLEAAGVLHARLIVITTTNDSILPDIISQVKTLHAALPIVVRVEEIEDVETLSSLQVREVVQPQFEVGVEMVRQAMVALNVQGSEVERFLERLRSERYQPVRR